VAYEYDFPILTGVVMHFDMHLGDQGTGRIEYPESALTSLGLYGLGYTVGTEDDRSLCRHFGQFLHEHGPTMAEFLHDMTVVYHLMADINGRAENVDGSLHDINGPVDTGAETAGIG